MSQGKQVIHPKRPLDTGTEEPPSPPKPAEPIQVSDLNVDELLSKDAEEFLKNNQQKNGQ